MSTVTEIADNFAAIQKMIVALETGVNTIKCALTGAERSQFLPPDTKSKLGLFPSIAADQDAIQDSLLALGKHIEEVQQLITPTKAQFKTSPTAQATPFKPRAPLPEEADSPLDGAKIYNDLGGKN